MLLPRLIVCFIVGIFIADSCYEWLSGYELPLFIGALCAFLVSFFIWRGRRIFCVSLATSFLFIGAALLVNERDTLRVSWSNDEQVCVATQLSDIKEKPKSYQLFAEVEGHRVRLTLMKDSTTVIPSPSDRLLLSAQFKAPKNAGNPGEFDYANYLHRQGVSGTALCDTGAWRILKPAGRQTLAHHLTALRTHLLQRLRTHLDGQSLEVAAAMTLGDKQLITKETRLLYSETGASHILALSGLHLSILFALFNLLLLRPLRSIRWVGTVVQLVFLSVLWGFVVMVGAPLSLVRAAVMLTLVQFSVLLRRDRISLHNLSLAALLLLLCSSQSLFDVGFQLSFMAVLSILVITPRLPRLTPVVGNETLLQRLKWWMINAVQDLLRVSIAAQIGTLPLVLYYFHTFPTYALPLSLWVIPLAGVVLILALLFFLIPCASALLGALLSGALSLMHTGLEVASRLPFASFHLPITLPTVVLLYSLVPLTIWGMSHFRRRPRLLLLLGCVIIACGVIESKALYERRAEAHAPQLIIYNVRNAMAVHVVRSAEAHYLWTADSARAQQALAYVSDTYWEKNAWSAPRYLSTDTLLDGVKVRSGVMQAGGYRMARLGYYKDAPLPPSAPTIPLPVDALLLLRGSVTPLAQVLRYYAPATIILDASMGAHRKQVYKAEATASGLPVYDIAEQGAFIVSLTNK